MRDRRIAKRPHDMQERVGIAVRDDVEQGGGVAAARRHVGELDRGRHALLRLKQRRQLVEAIVGYAGDAHVRLGATGRARRLAGARHQLKERGLA